mgnify:CR=1 FL=1
MTSFATMIIGNERWVLPAAVLAAAALYVVIGSYRRASSQRWIGFCAAALKTCGLLALAACLIEPLYSGVRARPGANLFAIAVDNSQSQTIARRNEQVQDRLGESQWQTRLGQDFELRRYLFAESLQSVPNYNEIPFDGNASQLGHAITTIAERFQDRPLAGILLFSDGNATDFTADFPQLKGVPPIYPVIGDDDNGLRDIGIESVAVSRSPFEDAPISVKAQIRTLGDVGETVTAEVLDPQGERVAHQSLSVDPSGAALAFRLQFAAPHRGVEFYQLRVAEGEEFDQFDDSSTTDEATLANNQRTLTIDRGTRPQRVLYVSGRPNWEFKFLRRALEEDEAVQLTALIRIAKREPKFKWKDNQVDSSNPLFRGFDEQDPDEKEQYDQPVFVRIETQDGNELREGFPKITEQLFVYDAVILDDVEAEFFTRDQMALLEEFVSRRGGSLLMLGGQESFRRGGYARTPLRDLLPVYLDREPAATPSGRLRLTLSRDGWLQPWIRLRGNEQDEQARLNDMPSFQTLNPLTGIKPGAMVLAYADDGGGNQFPALVAQQFGRGKTAAVAIGDLWRWALRRASPEQNDQARATRQLVRWLIADVPGQVEATVESDDKHVARIEVRARNKDFQPLDNAAVKVTVAPVAGTEITLDAEPSLDEPGLFTVEYVPREPAAYRVTAEVTDGTGSDAGQAVAGWVYQPAVEEFRKLTWNRAELQRIAEATGGQVVEPSNLESFVRELPEKSAPVTEHYTYPLWHQSTVFLFALSCFIGEWGLRRFRGLP